MGLACAYDEAGDESSTDRMAVAMWIAEFYDTPSTVQAPKFGSWESKLINIL